MGLAGAGTANQDGIALLGNESAAGEIIDQGLVDGRTFELEVLEVLGKRQFGIDPDRFKLETRPVACIRPQ